MALIKPETLETGVVAEYWRIRRIMLDYSDPGAFLIELGLYANEAARRAGFEPVAVRSVDVGFVGGSDGDDFRGVFYEAVAALPEFDGAKVG